MRRLLRRSQKVLGGGQNSFIKFTMDMNSIILFSFPIYVSLNIFSVRVSDHQLGEFLVGEQSFCPI